MTDKQIIIDGIDVSGCEFYNKDDKTCREVNGKYNTDICEFDKCDNPNCHFKQLTRKTQECEELKDKIIYMEEYVKIVENARNELERENKFSKEQAEQKLERIKDIAEPYRMAIKKICNNCKKYDSCHACCYKDISCYKYTSPNAIACDEFTYLDKFLPNIISNQILQIIDEVE